MVLINNIMVILAIVEYKFAFNVSVELLIINDIIIAQTTVCANNIVLAFINYSKI